jgi:hypothetical protein
VAAFGLSALVSRTVFEGLPHLEDEIAYLFQAKVFAAGHVVADIPEPSRAFWQPFVIDHRATGHRFGKYPPGWPMLLALGLLVGAPWLVNAAAAGAVVILTYQLGRDVYDQDVGVAAALLVALSPAVLLLSGTLMPHSSSLLLATLTLWASWRWRSDPARKRWPALIGAAVGLLLATRPTDGIAVGLPLAVWTAATIRTWEGDRTSDARRARISGLAVLVGTTLVIAALLPAFNAIATGDPLTNLYTMVWPYDRLGFGSEFGRGGHTLSKGLRNAGFDLPLAAADLFGWQLETVTPEMETHLVSGASRWPGTGLSFVLLPVGIVLGTLGTLRGARARAVLLLVWSAGAVYWLLVPRLLAVLGVGQDSLDEPLVAWVWLSGAAVWILWPLATLSRWRSRPETAWTWLLAAVAMTTIILHMAYWTGSMRYSTRYYFVAVTAAAVLSAIPLSWLDRGAPRALALGLLAILCLVALGRYTMPRVAALFRFNGIEPGIVERVRAEGGDHANVLALVVGPSTGPDRVRWQAYGALMAATSPFLDSEIVAARDLGVVTPEKLLRRFPGRTVVQVRAAGGRASLVTEPGPSRRD